MAQTVQLHGENDGRVTVVAVVREPLDLTLRFVGWYLKLGASKIRLYFDNPDDEALSALAEIPIVECIRCSPDFWKAVGVGPSDRYTKRQMAALTHGYRETTTTWFLAVDADELVFLKAHSLGGFAQLVAADVLAVRFPTAEAVKCKQRGSFFRLQISRQSVRRVYGERADAFLPRGGLIGHADGKSMTRSGLSISKVRPHWVLDEGGEPVVATMLPASEGNLLLHFFDNGYAEWRRKLEWRLRSWSFSTGLERMFSLAAEQEGEDGYRKLYDLLHTLTDNDLERLAKEGGCVRLDVDPWEVADRGFRI